MKAVSRFGKGMMAAGLVLVPAIALAQETPATNSSQPDTVGPKTLQDFSLSGTVTRPADQPAPIQAPPKQQPTAAVAAPPVQVADRPSAAVASRNKTAAPASAPTRTQSASAAPPPAPAAHANGVTAPSSSSLAELPVATLASPAATTAAAEAPPPATEPVFAPDPQPAGVAGHGLPMLPWLLAAFVLALGGAFLFWRNRTRAALASGPQFDLFAAPDPAPAAPPEAERAPAPPPRPAPAAPPPPKPPTPAAGVVSTRLRPWVEIGFQPLRCILEDQRVLVEFDVELFNSGSAPARAVLVEATLLNAGPGQDPYINAFFANPIGTGERIPVIPPLKRMTIRSQVALGREQVQAYDLGGRQVFVPIIAFNALYGWTSGEGQTSVSYLLGRDTKGEKMGPFRLDLGPHIFRGLASRVLPIGVRK